MRLLILLSLIAAGYAATGVFVVRGNEKAVVRRFGRVVTTGDGRVLLRPGGLHIDLPRPFSKVDRVNLNEVRTLTIGSYDAGEFASDDVEAGGFLQPVDADRRGQFLTGDKNILNVQVTVQYRVSEQNVYGWLYGSASPEQRLRRLVESVAVDLISRSGVDFVHPLGRARLRDLLTARLRVPAARQVGVEIDEVALTDVRPPLAVKAWFLDVSNARADMEKYVNAARAYEEQRMQAAFGEEQEVLNEARSYRDRVVEAARGEADGFRQVVERMREVAGDDDPDAYDRVRSMTLYRRHLDTVSEVLRKSRGKVFLDSGRPVDLTIIRDPQE